MTPNVILVSTLDLLRQTKMVGIILSLNTLETAGQKLIKCWNYVYDINRSVYLKYSVLLLRSS